MSVYRQLVGTNLPGKSLMVFYLDDISFECLAVNEGIKSVLVYSIGLLSRERPRTIAIDFLPEIRAIRFTSKN